MYIALIMFFFDVILYILVIISIPQKKYYKINHFKNFLLNYEDNSKDIYNYIYIIIELDSKLENYSRINQAILGFSIILLICSIAIILIIIICIFYSREKMIKSSIFKDIIYGINLIRLFLSFIDWSMALAIVAKINKIRKREDKIGLTNEIKSGIIKVIIILTFYFIYCIFETLFIAFYTYEYSRLLFLYNEYYIEKELNKHLKKEQGKNDKINNEYNSSVLTLQKKVNSEINEFAKLINEKDKDINELKDQVKILEQINNNQNKEIEELKSENPYKLKKNEKLITIIFFSSDQKIHYSLICKNTQKFAFVEQELYDIFPEYKKTENIFLLNGEKINRNKTIEEINIKFSDIITVIKYDDCK